MTIKPRWVGYASLALTVGLLTASTWARPGGGGSYSSGRSSSSSSSSSSRSYSSSSSGSSGSADGGAGFAALVLLLVIGGMFAAISKAESPWTSSGSGGSQSQNADERRTVSLAELRTHDRDFSQVVFEDFAFRLYATAHRNRHDAANLSALTPYVLPWARALLASREPVGEKVVTVVIGSMRPVKLTLPTSTAPGVYDPRAQTFIVVEYESNITTQRGDHFSTYYVVERWTFARAASVVSRGPQASQSFACPNCNAPWTADNSGSEVCAHCSQTVENGRFDWAVPAIALLESRQQPPTFTANTVEAGNDAPTILHPQLSADLQRLLNEDPALSNDTLLDRVSFIYSQLNAAWASNELTPVRGLVSSGLYDYLMYSVSTYVNQGLINRLVDMRITARQAVRIVRDKYYDAITFRIWATGKDYMERLGTGELVSGSRTNERAYTEYWTVIRSAARRGATKTDASCPNCGGPINIGQAGSCSHCNAYLASGDFDWVLSKIEQDDAYTG